MPLAFIGPCFALGGYAVGSLDALIWASAVVAASRAVPLPSSRSPISAYILLFFLGWLFATVNGYQYGVRLQTGDLVILYRLAFCFAAWWLGYRAVTSVDRVFISRVTQAAAFAVIGIAVYFAFSSYGSRVALISLFQPMTPNVNLACLVGRLPGINEAVNIYSFVPLCALIFSFDSFMRRSGGILVATLSLLLIIALGSRLTVATAAFVLAAIFLFPGIGKGVWPTQAWGSRMKPRNRLLVAIVLVFAVLLSAWLWSLGVVGIRLDTKLSRTEAVEDTHYRQHKWHLGMRRVGMAPILGIPMPRGEEREHGGYFLKMIAPHNEFIQIWMWYGFLGMAAHAYLLLRLVWRNIQYRTGTAWLLFYLAVVLRMLFDAAFKSYLFSGLFFALAGLNWQLMDRQAQSAAARAADGQPRRPTPMGAAR
jgi:hypothetical protein